MSYDFAGITNAFAVVRLRRLLRADHRCELADLLLVSAGNNDRQTIGYVDLDSGLFFNNNGVREADGKYGCIALFLDSVTDTLNFESLGVSVDYALDHVGDEGAGKTMEGLVEVGVIGTLNLDGCAFHGDLHLRTQGAGKGSLGSLNGDDVAFGKINGHACGYINNLSTNS